MATEPPKPKRRWLRYSLRTFVVVLTVFGIWLGLLVHRVNKQREAVQWVKDEDGICVTRTCVPSRVGSFSYLK